MDNKYIKNWYLGFLGFLGFYGLSGYISEDWSRLIWVVWFLWFVYFVPSKFIKKFLIFIILFLLMFWGFIFYKSGNGSWVCDNGQWTAIDNPRSEKPTSKCESNNQPVVTNFTECESADFPVMETFPRQCRDNTGKLFIEELEIYNDLIILENPKAEQTVKSPLEITGQARGNWFFEATFPVVLTNWDGLIIAEGLAQAEGDWMTEEFVPFKAILEFESDTSVSNRGSLILKKDNPSGLPENDDALEITVFFE